jgi:hypothetical protein
VSLRSVDCCTKKFEKKDGGSEWKEKTYEGRVLFSSLTKWEGREAIRRKGQIICILADLVT